MAFNKRLFTGGTAACLTETTDIFGDSTGKALYSLDYDSSDTSGTFNGEPYNGVNFGVLGKINTGARFNGTNQFIELGTDVFKYTDVTISAFINPNLSDTNVKTIFGNTSYINGQQFHGIIISVRNDGSSDKIYVQHYPSSTAVYSTASISLNTFTHIAVSYTGSQTKIYINGSLDSTHSASLSYSGSQTLTASLGAYILQNYTANTTYDEFSGTIDQVRVFSSILDGTKISTLAAETACVHTSTTDDINFPVTNAAYYKLDNSSVDSHSGTYNGTESNIEYRFGRYGQAAVFNGSSSKIEVSNPVIPNGAASISFWYNPNGSTGTQYILGQGVATASKGITVYYHNLAFGGLVAKGTSSLAGSATGSTIFNNKNWHHIVFTWDGSTTSNAFKIYVNGNFEVQGTSDTSSASIGTYTNFAIGGLNGGTFAGGRVDQVRIFGTELSAANVTSLYNEKPETDTSNFKTVLWNANGASNYISNVGMDLETSGGLVWTKARNQAYNHSLYDSVRGVNKLLQSNTTSTENPVSDAFNSFEANGFFLGANDNSNDTSGGATNSVGWVWKGGGAAVSNGNGSITSSVSANTAAGFSISKGTAPSSSGTFTVGHGLSSTPELVIYKTTDEVGSWITYTATTGASAYLTLNGNAAAVTGSAFFGNTAPTSSVYTLNSGVGLNTGKSFLGLCFHSVAGYQKIGSYTGNSSTTGPIVYTTDDGTSSGSNGFRPRFIMVKGVTASYSSHWMMMDSVRDTDTVKDKRLLANLSNIETDDPNWKVEFLDNGFQPKSTFSGFNDSNGTYIFLAIK